MEIGKMYRPFLEDKTWVSRAQRYSGMDEASFSDLLGAFFADRSFAGAPITPPSWASQLEGAGLLRKQEEVIEEHGWDRDMSILGIVHLEDQAASPGKEVLLSDFV